MDTRTLREAKPSGMTRGLSGADQESEDFAYQVRSQCRYCCSSSRNFAYVEAQASDPSAGFVRK